MLECALGYSATSGVALYFAIAVLIAYFLMFVAGMCLIVQVILYLRDERWAIESREYRERQKREKQAGQS